MRKCGPLTAFAKNAGEVPASTHVPLCSSERGYGLSPCHLVTPSRFLSKIPLRSCRSAGYDCPLWRESSDTPARDGAAQDNPVTTSLRQIAALVNGEPYGDLDLIITAARPLCEAQPGHITFVDHDKHFPELHACGLPVRPWSVCKRPPMAKP